MAELPIIDNVFRVTLNVHNNGGGPSSHNVIHLDALGLSESDVGEAFFTHATDEMFDALHADFTISDLDIIKLDGTSATQTYTTTGPPLSGNASENIIYEGAAVVSLRTLERGPKGRGRLFVGPVGEGAVHDGLINVTSIDPMQDAWTSFITDIATDDVSLVVASYAHEMAFGVQAVRVDSEMGTQRRRLIATRS